MELRSFVADFSYARLCDRRLDRRLAKIVSDVSTDPSLSFPDAMGPSALLGYYRFVNNECLGFEEIFKPHFDRTFERAGAGGEVWVAHDSSDLECSGIKLRGHFSLAISPDRNPYGLVSVLPSERGSQEKKKDPSSEQDRWAWGMYFANRSVPNAIHIADREADDYKLFRTAAENGIRFVIRSRQDRRLSEGGRLYTALNTAPAVAERMVRVSKRKAKGNPEDKRAHPAREERLAQLSISAMSVELCNPANRMESLSLNVVYVQEVDTPEGCEPVEWTLLTTESISTPEEILKVVDIYRARWMIEEFFKALKTGCQFEKRQHESYHAILIALAILAPMALQAMQLREVSRRDEVTPANTVLTEQQIQILSVIPRTKGLPLETAKDALLAVASLGGHLKNNGQPGWLTIGRGLEKLLAYEVGWQARGQKDVIYP